MEQLGTPVYKENSSKNSNQVMGEGHLVCRLTNEDLKDLYNKQKTATTAYTLHIYKVVSILIF